MRPIVLRRTSYMCALRVPVHLPEPARFAIHESLLAKALHCKTASRGNKRRTSELRTRTRGSRAFDIAEKHSLAQMIQPKNIGCRWYSSVFFLRQPTGHWFSCQMGVSHWSPSVGKTDEDQRQPMFFCCIIWAIESSDLRRLSQSPLHCQPYSRGRPRQSRSDGLFR